ncbi:CoA pyrophosphatase [Mycobacterium intracellulare]|uniref:NUDIX hydrolase n=1 Tax=Mycobacterium intracellulare TaxID=1767 RepID=UPI001CDA55DC|nr:CoA pyrophosphatase [Mycobacterium intracellulare]MCA2252122.1 CoA pyrophosphatase [Mycobacterium intracellulare]UGU03003.1 CoA pyrophosphatase [Mycobacterium intracellulare]
MTDSPTDIDVDGAGRQVGPERLNLAREVMVAALQRFSHWAFDGGGLRRATVVIVVHRRGEEFGIWIIERASGLRHAPGQYALPGGRSEPGEDVIATGLRELEEETGIVLGRQDVLGRLDDYVTRSDHLISTIVCWAESHPTIRPNPGEVARAYFVPLADLLVTPRFPRDPQTGLALIEFPLLGVIIHAATGALLYQFAEVVLRGRHTRVAAIVEPRIET